MTPWSLVVRHQNFWKMRCLDLNPKYMDNSWWCERQHGHKDVVFVRMVFASLQPSPYTVSPSLLLHSTPLTLKGICSSVCLKPLLANRSSYWMHTNPWAASGSELPSSNWSLIVSRNPFTINLKAFWLILSEITCTFDLWIAQCHFLFTKIIITKRYFITIISVW